MSKLIRRITAVWEVPYDNDPQGPGEYCDWFKFDPVACIHSMPLENRLPVHVKTSAFELDNSNAERMKGND